MLLSVSFSPSILSGYGWPRGLYCNSGPTAEHCHRLLEDELGVQCSCEYGSWKWINRGRTVSLDVGVLMLDPDGQIWRGGREGAVIRSNQHSEKLEIAAVIISPVGSKKMTCDINVRVKHMIKNDLRSSHTQLCFAFSGVFLCVSYFGNCSIT